MRPGVTLYVIYVIALCLLAETFAAPWQEQQGEESSKERWLVDEAFYEPEYPDDQPQADGTGFVMDDLCPPVPKVLPDGGCDVEECSSDRHCSIEGHKCCYNGCVYTCLPELKPAPFLDWIREPRRRLQFGPSWLVPGPDETADVELCSTTPPDDDSDPLICPHGYQCLIHDEGNPEKGLPNSGVCVRSSVVTTEASSDQFPLRDTEDDDDDESSDEDDDDEDRASLHACRVEDSLILLSGHQMEVQGRMCVCLETELKCEES